uniref:Uncharacterized protein n=1 Tax=Tanacetum cinerariifolium TaxID=118510 RepID=A0A6L2N271_TANCI|nr:hypothetical protein [Tanacetum cinerariifolium]
MATITYFSPKAHTFVPECNAVVKAVHNKDTRELYVALKEVENNIYIFQYHFIKGARPRNSDFTLDAFFKPTPQPLLTLPATEITTPPPTEILQQTSSIIPTTGNKNEGSPSPKTNDQELQTKAEEKTNKAK